MRTLPVTVHLHTPTSAAPVCGAAVPTDRSAALTAWRSKVTCRACLATLSPVPCRCLSCDPPAGSRFAEVGR